MAIYALADRLHMTAGRLMAEMTPAELVEWYAFFRIRERESGTRRSTL